jgi:hypothetical protein
MLGKLKSARIACSSAITALAADESAMNVNAELCAALQTIDELIGLLEVQR